MNATANQSGAFRRQQAFLLSVTARGTTPLQMDGYDVTRKGLLITTIRHCLKSAQVSAYVPTSYRYLTHDSLGSLSLLVRMLVRTSNATLLDTLKGRLRVVTCS